MSRPKPAIEWRDYPILDGWTVGLRTSHCNQCKIARSLGVILNLQSSWPDPLRSPAIGRLGNVSSSPPTTTNIAIADLRNISTKIRDNQEVKGRPNKR